MLFRSRIFPLADPLDPMSGFDVSSMAPDVVILALGGLDFAVGQPVDNGPATIDDFAAGYAAFTRDLREAYPSAQILCVVGPPVEDEEQNRMIRDKVFAGITKAVAARKAAGDARVSMFALSLAPASELTGCDGHGNPGFHQRVARELLPVVKSLTGW